MSSTIRADAIQILSQHRMTPDSALIELESVPHIILRDEEANPWVFIKRHQSRRYLMAKNDHMVNYIEIYSSSH